MWPLSQGGRSAQGGAVAATSLPGVLTASGTAHTKGSWSQLVASLPFAASELWLFQREGVNANGVNTSILVDLGVGGAGSETVVVANMAFGFSAGGRSVRIPIRIPAGSRIAARIQGAVVSETIEFQVIALGGGYYPGIEGGRRAVTYGANTGTSSGTVLTAAGATNTKSAWTQINGSTTAPIRWLVPFIVPEPIAVFSAAASVLVDVGVGASGQEQVIVPDLAGAFNSTSEYAHTPTLCVPVNIPAGARLAARYQTSAINTEPAVVLVGVD